eukprot:bmy_02558T0
MLLLHVLSGPGRSGEEPKRQVGMHVLSALRRTWRSARCLINWFSVAVNKRYGPSPNSSILTAVMEIKKPSLAGESSWLWTGSGTEDTPTSKFLSPPGGKNRQDLIPRLEIRYLLDYSYTNTDF